jgi:hypothetical protein
MRRVNPIFMSIRGEGVRKLIGHGEFVGPIDARLL